MRRDAELAWLLAEAVGPCFTENDRHRVYTELGAGEAHVAIGHMLEIAVRERRSLPAKLASVLTAWLGDYIGNEYEPRIRSLLNRANRHT